MRSKTEPAGKCVLRVKCILLVLPVEKCELLEVFFAEFTGAALYCSAPVFSAGDNEYRDITDITTKV